MKRKRFSLTYEVTISGISDTADEPDITPEEAAGSADMLRDLLREHTPGLLPEDTLTVRCVAYAITDAK